MNFICLSGNLTKDPLNVIEGKLVKIVIASNYQNGENKEVDYFTVSVWNKQAENVLKFLKKGSKVLVQGSLHNRTYEKDGEKKTISEITASRVEFLSIKNIEDKKEDVKFTPIDDDDLPF